MRGYEKWSNYTIGKIQFVNATYEHPHRNVFVKWAIDHADSVIEVGPGELIEYESIKKQKRIRYTIVDVSDLFIKNCRSKFPEIEVVRTPVEDLDLDIEFDIVYAASLLEHLRDIRVGIKRLIGAAKNFHFVMFKWSYSGDLESHYGKGYWSSSFNISLLLDEIEKFGTTEYKRVACKNGDMVDFEEYSKGRTGSHRNGDYLMIHGVRNE